MELRSLTPVFGGPKVGRYPELELTGREGRLPRAMKIRELRAPSGDLRAFDPGRYLCGLQFYPADEPLGESDRDGLAQMIHYLAFLSLRGGTERFESSLVPHSSSAYVALETYFGHLEGWEDLPREADALPYRVLVSFLMGYYPPPERRSSLLIRLARWWKGRA